MLEGFGGSGISKKKSEEVTYNEDHHKMLNDGVKRPPFWDVHLPICWDWA